MRECKVEVSDYVGAGAGIGASGGYELYGRRVVKGGGLFLHLGLFGADGLQHDPRVAEGNLLLVQVKDRRPAPLSRGRIGGEVLALIANVGLYLNTGEIGDFFGGFFGLDPAEDDGVAKGAPLEPETATSRPATRPGRTGGELPTRPSDEPPAGR